MRTEFEIQVTLKMGDDWINITQWTAKKQGHVRIMYATLENKPKQLMACLGHEQLYPWNFDY